MAEIQQDIAKGVGSSHGQPLSGEHGGSGAAERLQASAQGGMNRLRSGWEQGRERVQLGMDRARGGIRTADERVRGFVSENPLAAIGLAIGAGFLIGKLLSRSRGD